MPTDLDIPETVLGSIDQHFGKSDTINIPFEKLDKGDVLAVSNINPILARFIPKIIKDIRGLDVKSITYKEGSAIFFL